MSNYTEHQRTKNGIKNGHQCSNDDEGGPNSQIPGLSQYVSDVPEERTHGRRVGILESDSDYVKLAKQGGQKGLLWHEETNVETKPNTQYKPPDWFSSDSESQEQLSPTKRANTDFMKYEEFQKSPTKGALQHPDAPYGSDNKSTWERDDDSFIPGEEKMSNQMEKMSITPESIKDANKFKKTSTEKKPAPVNMSKLLSFGYAEDGDTSNGAPGRDELSVTTP